MTKFLLVLYCLSGSVLMAQNFSVSGKIFNEKNLPISFVNVLAYDSNSENLIKGTTTDDDGNFRLDGMEPGTYNFSFQFLGFDPYTKSIALTSNHNFGTIILSESSEMLDETVITAKLPTVKKTPGKLVFNVENSSFAVGSTMDLLKKTPGVVVIGEDIQVKFSTPVVYINDKRVYLSAAEIASLLENTDAGTIKSIEVITNPSAKYDADAGTVLNIITSKPISIGYKGSLDATFEVGVYPKYKLGTSHFYKNNWLNAYAGYSYGKSRNYKEDDSYIRFFMPDGVSTKSIFETNFNRTSEYENHTANVTLDFTLDAKNSLSLTSNLSLSPTIDYHNNGKSTIYNPQRQVDSIINTFGRVAYEKENLSFALDYNRTLGSNGASLAIGANYIYYYNQQRQRVSSDYYLANNQFLRNNSFRTQSAQNNDIITGQADVSTPLFGGTLETGIKFSNVNTASRIAYFSVQNGMDYFNGALSDDFKYRENIYSEYLNFEREWEKWQLSLGVRGEFTDIEANSRSLGQVNNQDYFDVFPSASLHFTLNENNGIGLSYNRSIDRPRYQSLNPFRYYITERDYNSGSPTLVPAVIDKVTLTMDHKSKLFFEVYYENVANSLDALTFQNNENSTLERVDANLIRSYQYAFDITYFSSLNSWWWMHFNTSSFYLANEFYALQSAEETYTNDTFGQYLYVNNHFTLSKNKSFTADLTGKYISNFVFGNRYFKNQFFLNISFRKDFWNKRASLTAGVDDIFNTLKDMASASRYYNQDNHFKTDLEYRLFRVGFKYNFGNARLRDNAKNIDTEEGDRLQTNN
jgi:hypothetical protein